MDAGPGGGFRRRDQRASAAGHAGHPGRMPVRARPSWSARPAPRRSRNSSRSRAWPKATGSSVVPATPAKMVWRSSCRPSRRRIFSASWSVPASPIGLGARDTLRLEAGLNLYGQDMTEEVSPLAANMGWTVAWEPAERDFVGRAALEQQRAEGDLVGLVLESAACCVPIRWCGSTVSVTARSPVAVFLLRLANPSPWRACRPAPPSARKWRFVASGIRCGSCSRHSCGTARYWCKFDRLFCATAVNSLEDQQ